MKLLKLTTVLCTIIFCVIAGTQHLPAADATAKTGIHINSTTGIGTGHLLGIDFSFEGIKGSQLRQIADDGKAGSLHIYEATLAPDLVMRLESENKGKSVSLVVNGKNYGDITSGDKVEINMAREVMVNGAKRATE